MKKQYIQRGFLALAILLGAQVLIHFAFESAAGQSVAHHVRTYVLQKLHAAASVRPVIIPNKNKKQEK